MRDDEWAACSLLIEQGFRGDFDDAARKAYRILLDRFDSGEIVLAIQALVESGLQFRPAPGEIVSMIRKTQTSPTPSWEETWNWLKQAMDRWRKPDQDTLDWLTERCHPVVGSFAGLVTLPWLRSQEFFCPDRGGMLVHQLKTRWEEFVEVAEQRLLTGRALTAVGRGGGQPKTLDAASVVAGLRRQRGELEAGDAA